MAILVVFIMTLLIAGYVIKNTPETEDLDKQKVRFAAVTFTGILVLVLLSGVMAIVDTSGKGMDVFKDILTALTPIAGGIIGYIFAAKR